MWNYKSSNETVTHSIKCTKNFKMHNILLILNKMHLIRHAKWIHAFFEKILGYIYFISQRKSK